jgi:NitT/TauT family transport system permease protein/taurine transport system permease protein
MADISTLRRKETEVETAPKLVVLAAKRKRRSTLLARLQNLTALAVLILAWQLASYWLLHSDPYRAVLMPPPSQIAVAAWELIRSGELLKHVLDSLAREATAFCFALLAVPLGLAMGWSQRINNQLDPIFEVLRPIPPLAWIPLSILWFGIGDQQNEFIILLGMVFPILLNTIGGVKNVDANLVRAARSLGAPEWKVLSRVVLKAALPQIVTGVRIGLGIGWMALVAAELVGANSGLGFLINDARSILRTDIIIVGMLTIGIVGLIIDVSIRALARQLLPWSQMLR